MKPILILSLICLFSAATLSGVNLLTKNKIIKAQKNAKLNAVRAVFSFPISNIKNKGTFYEVFDKAKTRKGIGVICSTEIGYGGHIEILLGVDNLCKITDYNVLSSHETPGLGEKMKDDNFRVQFKGKSLEGFNWKVKKDGGDVDAITAATISSRAITDAINKCLIKIKEKYGEKC